MKNSNESTVHNIGFSPAGLSEKTMKNLSLKTLPRHR